MAERRKIGLIYHYNENWIGGTYYIENIIHSLRHVEEELKPSLVIFTDTEQTFEKLKQKTAYPYLIYESITKKLSVAERLINKVSRFLFGKNLIVKSITNNDVVFLFPNPTRGVFRNVKNEQKIFWIPDFQEIHLPQFFTERQIKYRSNNNKNIAETAKKIVFSSKSALKDFKDNYTKSSSKQILLPFSVTKTTPEFTKNEIVSVLQTYNITTPFFIVPNQLWVHKNHTIILEAAQLLKAKNDDFQILCTGKEFDSRNPDYPAELKAKNEALNLSNTIKFLGFIPKNDLEVLIQESIAVIQPSLFEGWNTGIEESKCDSKFILASDIPVHREQLENYPNKKYFNNVNAAVLAEELKIILEKHPQIIKYDYTKDVKRFSYEFLQLTHL